ncbi:putative DNA-binding transcriptional activator DevR/DosR [Candidatus Hydrogenisulfobacillus filiaventi]|uniref:Stage 0 sporulation protein A homolog n=1 Tax=Candidatus Hydrogenisulfobacillus filiaventi TaxID=2707344 RepID=A0A6F8ZEA7_9FIRM|nr:response regulator transcription factor [Bacillota bacterium]CAB1127792.1 putative DNA-binding transcriptional activator DevR/DosR [Candidatus Hydrogenisulfobacillus filiaventi]
MKRTTRTTVWVIDPDPILRRGLRAVLGPAAGITVLGESAGVAEALAAWARQVPAVVVLEPAALGPQAPAAVAGLRAAGPHVLLLAERPAAGEMERLLLAGAGGYLAKTAGGEVLAAAVRSVAAGHRVLDGGFRPLLAGPAPEAQPRPADVRLVRRLSARERAVVKLTAWGMTAREIGERLSVSAKTVETYRSRACAKLGVQSRAELVQWCFQAGLWTPGDLEREPAGPPGGVQPGGAG